MNRVLRTGWILLVLAGICGQPAAAQPEGSAAARRAAGAVPAGELPRRPFLGIALAPLTDEQRAAEGWTGAGGGWIAQVVPGSSAAKAGVPAGAVLASIAGQPIETPQSLGRIVSGLRAGQEIDVRIWDDGKSDERRVRLEPVPMKTSEDFEIVYGQVTDGTARYRTIATRPKGDGARRPALLFIQGLGCFTVDNPVNESTEEKIGAALTRAGYVTLRVDKPGTGDSEGGPCIDVDFDGELRAYRAALEALKRDPGVDSSQVFIFGHSMGGIMAPLLAREIPVRGIAVYGTGVKSWLEYTHENNRRQYRLEGMAYPDLEREMKDEHLFTALFYVQRWPLSRILDSHPQFREDYPDTSHIYGKPYRYFQRIYDTNLAEAWTAHGGHALAIWGTSDFVSTQEDHAMIADIVNAARPGRGEYRALEETDHWLNHARSMAASREQLLDGTYNEEIEAVLEEWLERVRSEEG